MADNNLGFDLGTFAEDWKKQEELRATRQAEETKALTRDQVTNQELAGVQDQSLKARQGYVDAIVPVVKQYRTLADAQQKQQALMQSGGFMDHLQLLQDQMTNPSLYTSEGRQKTRAELNAGVALAATLNDAQQNVFSGQMDQIKNRATLANAQLEKAKLLERQNSDVIQAQLERQKAITEGLSQTATAKDLLLSDLSGDQLLAAKQDAIKNGGKTNIQGFDISQAQVETRIAAQTNLAYEMKLKQLKLEEVDDKLVEQNQNRILASMSLTQKQNMIAGKPIQITDGKNNMTLTAADFKPNLLKQSYDLSKQIFDDQISQQMNAANSNDVAQTTMIPMITQAKTIVNNPSIPETNPVKSLAKQHMAALDPLIKSYNAAEDAFQKNPTPENKLAFDGLKSAMQTQLAKEQQDMDATIDKQAKLDARGDPDLSRIIADTYRGNPVSKEAVYNSVTGALTTGKSIEGALPHTAALLVQKAYSDKLNELRQTKQMTGDMIADTQLRKQAAIEALDVGVSQMTASATDQFIGGQANLDPNKAADAQNPIASARDYQGNKIFTPETFLSFTKKADSDALELLKQTQKYSNLDDKAIADLSSGKSVTISGQTITPDAFLTDRNRFENVSLMLSLDLKKPGLAQAYINWWKTNGTEYAKNTADGYIQTAATGSVQDNVIRTLGSQVVQDSVDRYNYGVLGVEEDYKQEQQNQRKQWVSYDLDPLNRQAALLQFDKNLSDQDKTVIMRDGIGPLIQQAKSKGLAYDDTNILVENALSDPEHLMPQIANNQPLKKALAKMYPNRGHTLLSMEAITDSPWLYGNDKEVPTDIWSRISPGSQTAGQVDALQIPGENLFSTNAGDAIKNPKRIVNTGVFGSYSGWLQDESNTKPYDWFRALKPVLDPQSVAPAKKESSFWDNPFGLKNLQMVQ